MQKMDKKGHHLLPRYKSKMVFERISNEIAKENRPHNPRQDGIRTITLETYHEKGRDAAIQAIKEANKRIGKEVYTLEILDRWIKEDSIKKDGRDDDGVR